MTGGALAGFGVLLTRPRHQAGELASAIETAGGLVFLFPVIDIVAQSVDDIAAAASALPSPDIIIFVSRNAVTCGLPGAATGNAIIAAIGPATRAALETAGQRVGIIPASGFTSEHLLQQAALRDVDGKTIRIVRGNKGRERLGAELRDRGARVDYLPVYERRPAQHNADELAQLDAAWKDAAINSVIVMSVDSLNSLVAALPGSCVKHLRKTPLVTPSNRVIQTAKELLPGAHAVLASGPGTEDMVRALMATASQQ